MQNIVPLSREKLKTLRSLASTKIRKRKGICIVEGERAIGEASRSGNLLYLVCSGSRTGEDNRGSGTARFTGIPAYTLDSDDFSELSDLKTGTGLIGVAKIPVCAALEDMDEPGSTLVYLDGLQEPGNVGGMIRTSWALGIEGVMLSKGTADPFSAKGVRASAGGVFHVHVYSDVGIGEIRDLQVKGYSIFLAEPGGADLNEVHFPTRSILALGNEARGFSRQVREIGQSVGIPMADGADSLNVVVAGSIILERMRRTG